MSLNDISLVPFVAGSLYRNSLVETGTDDVIVKAPSVEPTEEPKWKFLGNNRQQVLIVVNHTDRVHLPDEELGFLTTIVSACKMDLGDVAIVNTNNYPQYSYKDYTDHFKSKTILLFGIDPISFGLPVDFPPFQIQSLAGCTFLYTPALEERNSDKLFKSKLWVCLKQIFNV